MERSTAFTILVITASMTLVSAYLDDVVILTTHGDIRGEVTSVLDRQVKVYWGIPYATIPARFQRPENATAWEGVLEATTLPPSCPEVPYTQDIPLIPPASTAVSEDCLYLNLWVPQGCTDKGDEEGLAVMVWIHGGALHWGSSTVPTYNGQVLAATQCVMVATLNYRLGVLGFLSLGTAAAPGNVGLLDQAMALHWIHHNAPRFGADPGRITLFGESAGGLSVGAHMVSPLSRDLFSRAIIQSGPVTASFAKRTVAENTAAARKLAGIMGCPVDDDDAMITCLSEADAEEMGKVATDLKRFSLPAFGIIVDDYFFNKPLTQSFLSNNLKQCEVMIGATKDDGSFLFPMSGTSMNNSLRPGMDQTTFHTILKNVVLPSLLNPPKRKELFAKLLEFIYIGSSLPAERDDYHTALEKILGDLNFMCPMYSTAAPLLAGGSDVYMYSFEHRSSISPFPQWMGVVHASELDFVFGRPLDQGHLFTERERQLSLLMMYAWANFAKFGNPNSEDAPSQWPPLNSSTYPYAVFRSPSHVTVGKGCRYRECVFWNEVYTTLVPDPSDPAGVHDHDEL
ncbi:acetylcholinesterase-like [Babylonia areolata]|uniref:acetylcholinesterase-like n=1 Tax=Babylonia areolata TaxID=304850 RepID=UPI003FD2D63E